MSTDVKESYFWQQVKAGLEDIRTHLSRIENTAGTGISDVSACNKGREVWLELKVFHGNNIHFRSSQRIWITRRVAVGGKVLVLARKDDELLLYEARHVLAAPFTSHGEDRKSFHVKYADMPYPNYSCKKPFRWEEVRNAIFPDEY